MRAKIKEYFEWKLSQVKSVIDVNIPITICNHGLIKDCEESLGLCHSVLVKGKYQTMNITIDGGYVQECYENEIEGKLRFLPCSLFEVICHEIAHIKYKNQHGKRHTALTQKYLELIEESLSRKTENNFKKRYLNS